MTTLRGAAYILQTAALAMFVVAMLAGPAAFAQESSKKRVRDPEAEALNQLLVNAQDAVDKKDYETAAQDYQQYLAKKPDDAQVHFNLGFVYTAEGKRDAAQPEYKKAISLDPKIGPAYLNLGMTLLSNDPAAAVAPLQQATQLLPDNNRAKFLLGVALERSGKMAEAIDAYRAAADADPKSVEARLALGHAANEAKRWPESEKAFHDALALNPNDNDAAEAYLGLSTALIAEQKLDEASQALGAYVHLRPEDGKALFQRADLLAQSGKDDDALHALDQLPPAQHDGLDALKLRAQIDIHANHLDDAAAALSKAEALAPKDAELSAQLGDVYMKKKNYGQAALQLTTAFNLNPMDNDLLRKVIAADYESQNYSTALAAIDLLAKRMDLPANAWFLRAACYDKLGQLKPALDAYKTFLQLNKDENSDMFFDASVRVRVITREIEEKKR